MLNSSLFRKRCICLEFLSELYTLQSMKLCLCACECVCPSVGLCVHKACEALSRCPSYRLGDMEDKKG